MSEAANAVVIEGYWKAVTALDKASKDDRMYSELSEQARAAMFAARKDIDRFVEIAEKCGIDLSWRGLNRHG